MKYLVAIVLCIGLFGGCIPTKPEAPEEITQDAEGNLQETLIDELIAILKEPEAHQNNNQPYILCDKLAAMSPTALAPIIELMGGPDTTPATQVFILQSININMTKDYLPFLEPLLKSGNPTTRSCATTLLGSIKNATAREWLIKLKEDENNRVSFSAWSGLAQHGEEPYRQQFVEYYAKSSTAQQSEIIRIIVTNTQQGDIPTLALALTSKDISLGLRSTIAMILGNMGTLDSVEPLQSSLQLEKTEDYQILVESAVALITERNNA